MWTYPNNGYLQDGKSGFHIDPYHEEDAAEKMAAFFERCQEEKDYWDQISQGAICRLPLRIHNCRDAQVCCDATLGYKSPLQEG